MAWKIGVAVCAALLGVTALVGLSRVSGLESRELRAVDGGTLTALRNGAHGREGGVRLVSAALVRDQRLVFEICADDPLLPERWADKMTVAVTRPATGRVLTSSALDADTLGLVTRNETSGCLIVGRGTIGEADEYAIELTWDEPPPPALMAVTFRGQMLARGALDAFDRGLVLALFGCALSILAFCWLRGSPATSPLPAAAVELPPVSPAQPEEDDASALDEWERAQASTRRPLPDLARLALGVAIVVTAFVGSSWLPGGATFGLGIGLGLAALQVLLGLGLSPGRDLGARCDRMGLHRPRRAWLHLPLAMASGIALFLLAILATQLVPSTGRSAVQVAVSWPSGMLSVAAFAVVAPLAEEIFFRGFVYGLLEQKGRVLAFLGAWLLFVVAHVPQTFGQWGALAAVLVTGLGLTALRAVSRSTLVGAVAHMVYNGLLAAQAVL